MFNRKMRLFLYLIIVSAISIPMPGLSQPCSPESLMKPAVDLRPDVKQYIERLKDYLLTSAVDTTDSMALGRGHYEPDVPKPFPAGRYEVLFKNNNDSKALLVRTESKIGHLKTITLGVTDVGGYVKIFNSVDTEGSGGRQLGRDEIDYLLAMIYSKYCDSLDDSTAARLSQLKDKIQWGAGYDGVSSYACGEIEKAAIVINMMAL